MSVSTYGIIRNANVNVNDIDVFYTYSENRNKFNPNDTAIKLDANNIINTIKHPNGIESLDGLYNMTLPASIFNRKGIYNIIIKPKEIRTKIIDCGILSSRPDIKGLVLDSSDPSVVNFASKFINQGLLSYRIEYIDPISKLKTPNLYRIVTSSFRCEPVSENLTNTNQKSIRYRYNDSANLLFLTITPSSTSFIKNTSSPYIGVAGQEIVITNTSFDPIMLEVEMVDQTIETIAHAIYGNQTKSIQDGKMTVYTYDTNEIFDQANLFEIKDDFDKPLYEIKEKVDVIDNSKEFNTIIKTIKI